MIYVVSPGDSLYAIAKRFGVSAEKIAYDNQLYGQKHLVVGQALLILEAGPPSEKIGPLLVTGYAYPFIDRELLRQELPFLDALLIFSYGFTPEGELIPPALDDLPLIQEAWAFGTEPVLVLTPFGPDGRFSNYLVSLLVNDSAVQQTLIENLLTTVQDRGYTGVDVDFEYVLAEDKDQYAAFVGNLRDVMNQNGFQVSVAVPPKMSDEQAGPLFGGMDFKSLGENADQVFLMTYEWGYTYGPPMAVAPLNQVKKVLDYAVTQIPRKKLVMGIPNYAYDWKLPFVRGVTAAELLGNVEAVERAAQNNTAIFFDETAKSPYYTYWQEESQHEVWFEDVRSIREKLLTANAYGFLGVGYWNLMRPFRANWLLLESMMA